MNIHVPYSGKFSLVQIFVDLSKKPTEEAFIGFNFVCSSCRTTPMPRDIGVQHSRVIYLQVHEPFSASVMIEGLIHTDRSLGWPTWQTLMKLPVFSAYCEVSVHF